MLGVPVLESYRFVPNFTSLDLHQSVRVNTQIILENALVYKVKAVELIDEFTNEDTVPLTPIIKSALEDQPLIQPFLKILSSTPFEDIDVEIEDKKLQNENDCLLVIASNLLNRPDVSIHYITKLIWNLQVCYLILFPDFERSLYCTIRKWIHHISRISQIRYIQRYRIRVFHLHCAPNIK